ncbi:MAG TPA: glycosyltransferase family 4 protein, partial [Pyrinomonadaceae bacterium]|nr:glycosyltransferase family 4 protein [Pyrinomonadaceae bacterium]
MKILHVSSAQYLGGGERYLADLANALAARGHDVYAALRPGSPVLGELSAVPAANVTMMPLRNAIDLKSARALQRFVEQHQIDIVHAHMARDYPLASYAVDRHGPARLIVTRHVLFPLSRFHKITLAQAARVIAVSEAVALHLRSQRIVPERKIIVVKNGIDVVRFERIRSVFDRQQFFQNWNLPGEALLVGTVGELRPLKGQEEFLRAAAQILQSVPNAFFIIAGVDASHDGRNRRHIERVIADLGLERRVRLIGWLGDVVPLHCALDVFVSASRAESFGLAIAEAMASGTAVVATRTEGAKEIIADGETGLLVPVDDVQKIAQAVANLLQHGQERERLGLRARESVRTNFSLDRMVEETLE